MKKSVICFLLALLLLITSPVVSNALGEPKGITTLISQAWPGQPGDDRSYFPSITGDGRFIAFASRAKLIENDTNFRCEDGIRPTPNCRDIYVYDRVTKKIILASKSSSGQQASLASNWPQISTNGRFVTFDSVADNLVNDDNNNVDDVFVRDLQTNQTERVSVSSSGVEGNDFSQVSDISGDGRYITFTSAATNLTLDTNNPCTYPNCGSNVFLHDRLTHKTELVSKTSSGAKVNGSSWDSSISVDGRYITYGSDASNIVPNDNNHVSDVFAYDRTKGTIILISITSNGNPANGASGSPRFSADSHFITFSSTATNLVPGDTNGVSDIFVRNMTTGQIIRVSTATNRSQANGNSSFPVLSEDGRYVAFSSEATNLSVDDTDSLADIYVHDTKSGLTYLASYAPHDTNEQNFYYASFPTISDNGMFIAFQALDYSEVATQIYLRDYLTPNMKPPIFLPLIMK